MSERPTGLGVALVITMIALPLLALIGQRSTSTEPAAAEPGDTVDVLGTAPLPFDQVTVPPIDAEPPVIVVPNIPEGVPLFVTYSSEISSPRDCVVGSSEVPFGIAITIRNVNNDRSIRCTNSIPMAADDEGLVILPLAAYVTIADVTDAPVPVEVTW